MPVFDYMGSTGLCQVDRPESSMGKFGPQRRKGGRFPGKMGGPALCRVKIYGEVGNLSNL